MEERHDEPEKQTAASCGDLSGIQTTLRPLASPRLASTPRRRANAWLSVDVVNCEKPGARSSWQSGTLTGHPGSTHQVMQSGGGEGTRFDVIRFCVKCRLGWQEEMQRKKIQREREGIKREYRKLIFISGSDEWNESET